MDTQELEQLSDEVFSEVLQRRHGTARTVSAAARDSRQRWQRISERASATEIFDRAIYEQLIDPSHNSEFSFDHFIEIGTVEEVSQLPGFYRSLLSPTATAIEPEFHRQLADEWRKRVIDGGSDPIWLLPHLLALGSEEAGKLLRKMLDDALDPQALQLDRAERILGVAAAFLDSGSAAWYDEYAGGAARVAARKLFAQDHYKSGRYLRRAELHTQLEDFVNTPSWLLSIHAAGGMGKTMFLRHAITREWLPSGMLVARIDFDSPAMGYHNLAAAPWLVLLPLAEQLIVQDPNSRLQRFLGYRSEWSRSLRTDDQSAVLRLERPAVRGIVASERGDSLEEFAGAFADGLPKSARIIVVVDTTEEPYLHGAEPFTALLELFRLIRSFGTNFKVILAGRYDLFARKISDNSERVPGLADRFSQGRTDPLKIEGFTESETRSVLSETYGLKNLSPDVNRIVFAKCSDESQRALPFDVALWARELRDHPEWTPDDIKSKEIDVLYLLERVLERIPNKEVRWLVRYSALLRRLNFELAGAVLMPEVRRQRALEEAGADRKDAANLGIPRPAYDTGVTATSVTESVWQELLAYAAGPEEGWINPISGEDGGYFVLHPRVLQPMRRLVERQPVWKELHAAAQQWFEDRAAESRILGDRRWTSSMCEAIFHAFQRGNEHGTELWYRLTAAMRPFNWDAAAKLAEVVLSDAGFESSDDEPQPLFDIEGNLRVPKEVERAAAEALLRGALWHWALEDLTGSQPLAQRHLGQAARRWLATRADPTHPFYAVLEALRVGKETPPAQADAAANELATVIRSKKSALETLLLQLVLARLQDVRGLKELALKEYSTLTKRVRKWSEAPVTKRQLLLLQTKAVSRLGLAEEETAKAFDYLLKQPIEDKEEEATLRLQSAEMWLSLGQPNRAIRMFAKGFRNVGTPAASVVRAHILQAECLLAVWRLDAAEHFLNQANQALRKVPPLDQLALHLTWAAVQGSLHSHRLNCKEARSVWNEAFSEALKNGLFEHAWRIGLALTRHMVVVERSVSESISFLKTLESVAFERTGLDNIARLNSTLALAELNLKLASRTDKTLRNFEAQDAIRAIREVAESHPQPRQQAAALAILLGYGLTNVDALEKALKQIEPPSARPLALAGLDRRGIGAAKRLTEAVANLFNNAFSDEKLSPQGTSSGRLRAAAFYRFWGTSSKAQELIESVARAAAKERNECLWRQASHAAFRSNAVLDTPAPKAPENSALRWMLLLEQTERDLNEISGPLKRPRLLSLQTTARTLLQTRDFEPLANTGYVARVYETVARVTDLGASKRPASRYWAVAADHWRKLGDSIRAEHCVTKAASQLKTSGQRPVRETGMTKDRIITAPTESTSSMPAAADFDFDDCLRLTFEKTKRRMEWHGASSETLLRPFLADLLKHSLLRILYQKLIKLWTPNDSNLISEIQFALREKNSNHPRMWAIADSHNIAVDMIPWEIAPLKHIDYIFRTGSDFSANRTQIALWIRYAVTSIKASPPKPAPGVSIRLQSLLSAAELGLENDTAGEVINALRELRQQPPTPQKRIFVTILDSKESSGKASPEAPVYRDANINVAHPAEKGWKTAIASIRRHLPTLIHFRCRIDDPSDSGDTVLQTRIPLRLDQLRDLIKEAGYVPGRLPVVLLDVLLEVGNDRENKRAILRRNYFCGRLWSSGLLSGIIATCQDRPALGAWRDQRHRAIVYCVARQASLAETARMLREEQWGPLAKTTALWAWHPQLPIGWDSYR